MAKAPGKFDGFASWFGKEQRAGDRLPYERLLDDRTVVLRDGSMMQTLHLEGFAFETADTEEVNHRQIVRAAALRAIGSSRFVLYHHIIRRRVSVGMEATYDDPVSGLIHDRWQSKLQSGQMFVNDLFITVVRRNPKGKVGFAESLANLFGDGMGETAKAAAVSRDHKELNAATDALLAALAPYGPRVLGGYDAQNGRCSEPLELLSALYNGEMRPVLRPTSDIGQYIPYRRTSFGLEAIEQSSLGEGKTFSAIVSLKDYPPHATPGMVDSILRLPFEMTLTESFAFVDRQIGLEKVNLALRRMRAADEEAMSLRNGLMAAKDELATGAISLGEHHLSLLVRTPTLAQLDPALAQALAALADLGAVAVREDVNLEPAFWAQFPGNEGYIARKAVISTNAYASFASLHGFPIGSPDGNHWGQAVTVFETSSGTPYYFNFHLADLGNFTVIGPSGSGKTVVLNFLAAQAQKFQPRTVLFDKDRGAEIFIRAIGGHYATLRPGEATGFNPLQLPDSPTNRAFLRSFIARLVTRPDHQVTAEEEAIIAEAVDANFAQDMAYRRLRYFRELLGGARRPMHNDLAARLLPWVGSVSGAQGEASWLFDNADDQLDMEARTLGFDMTQLLDDPVLRTPTMMYLFHRVEERLDGEPTIIIIDEGWKALDDEVFAAAIRNWMKTIRKRNAILGFGTQSARDALDSRISSAIIEQSATQIFMPNPRAQEEDYVVGFGLTHHELDLIRAIPAHSRSFLVKHGNHSVVARLDLGAMPDVLTVLSGRESSVRRLDELRAELGDDPALWWKPLTGTDFPATLKNAGGRNASQSLSPITLIGEVSVSRSMIAMDCHIDSAVRTGYDRLFGPGGGLGYALFGLLTIYIALLAYGFMTGRTRLTLTMMSPRIVAMVLVLAFVSFWPAYHAVFYGLLMNGPDEIAAMLLGQSGSAVLNFAETLDALFVRFAEIAMALDAEQKAMGVLQSQSMPVTLFWLSGLMLLVSTLGVLILTRLTLYLLLILGPIFILLGLFPQTRGLFNGWLRTALIFALAPLLTVLGGTAALMLFVPLINTIAENPLGNAAAVQPMVILFMGSVIYAAFLATLMWVSASLVRDWQAALRDKNPDPAPPSSGAAVVGAGMGAAYPMTVDASQRGVSDAYARTQPLVNAVTREMVSTSTSESSRVDSVAAAGAAEAARADTGQARTRGLGQSFRNNKSGARGKVVELR